MDENRKEARSKRLKEGRLVFNNKRSVMSCIVRDATKFGARVTIGEPYLVPFEFEFGTGDGELKPARKVWIRKNEMGLQFVG
jgi:two-component system cell cycle response regulator